MLAVQRHLLGVGQDGLRTVGFVAGGDEHACDGGGTARGLQRDPRPFDVGLEGGERRAVGNSHDSLRGQVEDRVDFVLVEHAFHQRVIGHVTARDADALHRAGAH